MNSKLVSLLLSGLISVSMVGCNNKTTQEDVSGDDVFLECFEDAINERRNFFLETLDKGLKEGIEKRDIEIVSNMISEGLSDDIISKLTKIDINKVIEIKNRIV